MLTTELSEFIAKSTESITVLATTVVTGALITQAFRQGAFKKITLISSDEDSSSFIPNGLTKQRHLPFENEQLRSYYSQVLSQSKTSFWFSLIFASIGFIVILVTAFMKTGIDTVPGFIAGFIVDSVSALFFVQSKNAQKSMAEFFDKLRLDKQQAEAKALCTDITNQSVKDALKVQLSLFYAGVSQHNEIAERIISEHLK